MSRNKKGGGNRLHREEVEKLSIGENIRASRLEKGLTQAWLAEQADITQSMLCQIERGTKNPSLQVGMEIARLLNTTVDELLKQEADCRKDLKERVEVQLPKDGDKYRDDYICAINGKVFQIQRGVPVMVPRYVAEHIAAAMEQEEYAEGLMGHCSAQYEAIAEQLNQEH